MQDRAVELLSGPGAAHAPAPPRPWYRGRRFMVFAIVTLLVLAMGLSYVYARPAIYRATATLLVTPPPPVDTVAEADLQHVMVQAQRLLSEPLLERTAARFSAAGEGDALDAAALRGMLSVEPVPGTNLVEVHADGPQPERLDTLVSLWLELYLAQRAADLAAATGETTDRLQEQAASLSARIEATRAELAAFRDQHEILSMGRDENQVLAKLKGLTASLNRASEELLRAQARRDTLRESIRTGDLVAPREERSEIAGMMAKAEGMRRQLADLQSRFTDHYISIDPKWKDLPEELEALEAEIAQRRRMGEEMVLSDAGQSVAEARQTVASIEAEIETMKARIAEFTARFAEHESLREDLQELEGLHRQLQAREARLVAENRQAYPPIDLVEAARVEPVPLHPDYTRDALLAVAAALLCGFAAAIAAEFFAPAPRPQAPTTLAGVRVYLDSPPEGPPRMGRGGSQALSREDPEPPPHA